MDTERKYPREVTCRKNLKVTIKPLEIGEIEDQMAFLRSLPEADLLRLPHDVLEPNYPKKVRRQIEDGLVYRMTAWNKEKIVGSLALYKGTSRWVQHTGSVVLVTHPDVRRFGVATVLFDEMIPLAKSLLIEKIYANLLDDHREAIRLFKGIGFTREALLHHHVKDTYGRYRHLRIYSMDLEAAHRAMEDLISDFNEYAG